MRSTRGVRRGAWIGAAVVAAWVAAAAIVLASAFADAQRAKRGAARVADDPFELVGVRAELSASAEAFRSAASKARSPVLFPLRVLPFTQRHLDAFASLAGASATSLEVGAEAAKRVEAVLDARGPSHASRVPALRRVAAVAEDASSRLDAVDVGPDGPLIAPLARARAEFVDGFARVRSTLERATVGADGLADILAGPRTYLLLAANNAEMRVGSGMFGGAGTVHFEGGRLELGEVEATSLLPEPDGPIALDADLEARWGWLNPQREWRNLGTTPRFAATAALAAEMWHGIGRGDVDGVIALDVVALSRLLEVTGPVDVDGRVLDAENVVEHLMLDQYEGLEPDDDAAFFDASAQTERREELGQIARAVMEAVDRRDVEERALASALGDAIAGRHLFGWSARDDDSRLWRAARATGDPGADGLMLSVVNRGGNKLDQFLHVSASLTTATPGDVVELEVTVDNRAPDGLPRYVGGPHPDAGAEAGEYVGLVTATLPSNARNARVDGGRTLAVAGADGENRVIAWSVRVPRGDAVRHVVRFDLPPDTGSVRILPSARVPAIKWKAGTLSRTDDVGFRVDVGGFRTGGGGEKSTR